MKDRSFIEVSIVKSQVNMQCQQVENQNFTEEGENRTNLEKTDVESSNWGGGGCLRFPRLRESLQVLIRAGSPSKCLVSSERSWFSEPVSSHKYFPFVPTHSSVGAPPPTLVKCFQCSI